jgi:hypothetical protein
MLSIVPPNGGDMSEMDGDAPAQRDEQGRYARGASGNPAGKPRGCLNHATRIAAELLNGEAEALWRREIDLAKSGDRMLLKHCNDKIIGPRRGQPVAFAMPPIKDPGDLAAAMGAVLRAAARGLITPAEAETLARAAAAGAHAVETDARVARERLADRREAAERRFALRACALLFYGIREIDEEAGGLDYRLRELCKPILHIGEAALTALAAIPDRPELVEADLAFFAAHPPRLERPTSPLANATSQAWLELRDYLDPSTIRRLDREIEGDWRKRKRRAPRYRTGLFERLSGLPWPPAAAGGEKPDLALCNPGVIPT